MYNIEIYLVKLTKLIRADPGKVRYVKQKLQYNLSQNHSDETNQQFSE